MNYARRQQYRRLSHAGKAGLGSVIAALFGLVIASAGAAALAGLLLLAAVRAGSLRSALAFARWSQSSRRPLRGRGAARARPSPGGGVFGTRCRGRVGGDIDPLAIAPGGIAIAIESKTRTYDPGHLARVREQAAWLSRRRRRWARNGALGVMCVVRARGIERVEDDVLVVSIDRLTHVLRVAARTGPDRRLSG